jgi:3-oxoacyl-[acyl-carrier-protein] synthase III
LDYHELAAEAMKSALEDAKLRFDQIDQVYCGYVYGDSTSGQ